MPELPEVEIIRKGLSRLIVGKKILSITASSPKQVQPSLAAVKKAITGARIRKIKRRAKLLQIVLSNGQVLVVHLKLTGRLLVREKNAPRDKWQQVVFELKGKGKNLELRFCDLRKFGFIRLVRDKKELEKLFSEFGPEPLVGKASSGFTKEQVLTLEKFKKILGSTSRPVKVLLMDQKKISGIGNIYASEALFLARINPSRPADKIKEDEAKELFKAISKVLKKGIRYKGASDQYFLDVRGEKGSYQEHFLVYNREGEKCFNCQDKIKKIKLGGRGTYFCPSCQK